MFSFFRKRFGGSLTDYAIGVGVITGGVIGGLGGLGGQVEDIINGVNDSIPGEVGEQTPGSGSGAETEGGSGQTTEPGPEEVTDSEEAVDPAPEPEPDVQPDDFQFVDRTISVNRVLDEFDLFLYTKNNNGAGVDYTINGTIPYGVNYQIAHNLSVSHYIDFGGKVRRPGTYNFSIRADLDGSSAYDLNNYSIDVLPYYNAFIPEVEGYDDVPGEQGSKFGSAVAIDGDNVYVVSNYRSGLYAPAGRIYQFDYDSQVEQFYFSATDTNDYNGSFNNIKVFGDSVFASTLGWFDHDYPLLPNQDPNKARGAFYEFDKSTGNQVRIYQFPEGYTTDSGNGFGQFFDVNDSYIAMSAPFLDYGSVKNVGRVYVYPRGGSGNLQTFNAISHEADESFGMSVALYNDYLFVGSSNKNRQGLDSGVVYMYDLTTGSLVREILPADVKADDAFGFRMTADNGVLAVGALVRSESTVDVGLKAIYLFDANTGEQIDKIRSSEIGDGEPFFRHLAMDGNYLALSSIAANGNVGKIYVYDISQKRMIASFSGDIDHGVYQMGVFFDIDGRRVIAGSPNGSVEQALKFDF